MHYITEGMGALAVCLPDYPSRLVSETLNLHFSPPPASFIPSFASTPYSLSILRSTLHLISPSSSSSSFSLLLHLPLLSNSYRSDLAGSSLSLHTLGVSSYAFVQKEIKRKKGGIIIPPLFSPSCFHWINAFLSSNFSPHQNQSHHVSADQFTLY